MCNFKEKLYIHNINRIVIACASLVAMLIDGVNTANCLYLGSAIVWLFLPECDAVEEQMLESIKTGKYRMLWNKLVALASSELHREYNRAAVQTLANPSDTTNPIKGTQ